MNILIVYATFSSSTMQASNALAAELHEKGHTVMLKKIADTKPEELGTYDLVFMGSPSWLVQNTEGMPHDDYLDFFKRAEGTSYKNKKFAVFGLGDESYAHFCGAVDHLTEFVTSTQGTLIGEPIRIDGYLFNEDQNAQKLREWSAHILSLFQ